MIAQRTNCYMQPYIWYYYTTATIQSEDLVQLISNVRYCWVNRLTLQLIVFQNTATFLRTVNVPKLTKSTISYINTHYLGLAYFRQTGMSQSNILIINWLIVKFYSYACISEEINFSRVLKTVCISICSQSHK